MKIYKIHNQNKKFFFFIMEEINFNINLFKTKKCKKNYNHNLKECIYYHFSEEKRRNPSKYKYNKKICKNTKCQKNCDYSHNFVEQLYHPDNYKKKFCKYIQNKENCEFGKSCALAHSYKELKIHNLDNMEFTNDFLIYHYKSVFCPFSSKKHNKVECPYAHDWDDFKRPFFKNLKPTLCENWKSNKKEKKYNKKCFKSFNCEYCHGWKEFDYHVRNMKKSLCKKKECVNINCFFFHVKERIYTEKKLKIKNKNFDNNKELNLYESFETNYSCFSDGSKESEKKSKYTNKLYYGDIFSL